MTVRNETAADIVISVGEDLPDLVCTSLQMTKTTGVDITGGSGRVYAYGYGITDIRYEGSMEVAGRKSDVYPVIYDDNGIPRLINAITVTHLDGGETAFLEVLVTSDGYEMNEGETVTTSFDIIAMRRSIDGVVDSEPLH